MVMVVGYARVSSSAQDLAAQVEVIAEHCARHDDWELIDIIEERVSGKADTRPKWDRLMDVVEKGKVEKIIFTKFDRVARSLKNMLEIVDTCQKFDVKLVPIHEPVFRDLESAQGRLIISLMGAIAEFEASLLKERMDRGKKRAEVWGTKSGKPMHRPKKEIDWDKYRELRGLGVPKNRIAKELGISRSTLYEREKELIGE